MTNKEINDSLVESNIKINNLFNTLQYALSDSMKLTKSCELVTTKGMALTIQESLEHAFAELVQLHKKNATILIDELSKEKDDRFIPNYIINGDSLENQLT